MKRLDAAGPDRRFSSEPAVKVAYIMSRFPKLSETFILYEILTLEKLGVQVEVYPLLRERQQVAHPEAQRWADRAHFHPFFSLRILRAQISFARRRPVAFLKLWSEVLRKTWGSPNFFVGAVGILPKAVRFAYEMQAEGITHIHAHFATHPAVAALIVHRLTGIPFSFTAHGSDLHVDRRMLDTKVAAAKFAVTVSDYNKAIMVEACGDDVSEKIRVIHCGVDPEFFAPRSQRASSTSFEILCVASYEEVKGHRYLVEACHLLRDRGIDFRCHLIGEGPLRRMVEKLIEDAGLRDQFVIHGGQPRPVVARRLAEADAAVLASHPTKEGKREGIPVALMEAMAAGLPVVATAISGIPELVESGSTGLLVPPRNSVALADALSRLAGDGELRCRMGRAGRKRVLRDFNLERNTLELVKLFDSPSGRVHPTAECTLDDADRQPMRIPFTAG